MSSENFSMKKALMFSGDFLFHNFNSIFYLFTTKSYNFFMNINYTYIYNYIYVLTIIPIKFSIIKNLIDEKHSSIYSHMSPKQNSM